MWYASSHSANLDAVETFLEFVTASDSAVELATGLPAYDATATKWLEGQAASGFFVGDFEGAISTAAASIWSGWGFPNFSPETAYAEVVVPALSEGTPIADVTEEWQQEYLNEAQVNGYDTAQ